MLQIRRLIVCIVTICVHLHKHKKKKKQQQHRIAEVKNDRNHKPAIFFMI